MIDPSGNVYEVSAALDTATVVGKMPGIPASYREAIVEDMDGDGRADVFLCSDLESVIYQQQTDHSFVPVPLKYHACLVGDMNADGLPDLVSGNSLGVLVNTSH